ncbi:MAG: putative ABC exporter domain-containing protein [Fimbriimonadaceae bacterium]
MKPLLFLVSRSFVNGLKRTLRSPGRILGLLAFLGYNFWIFGRVVFAGRGTAPSAGVDPFKDLNIEFPPIVTISGILFLAFAALVCLNTLGLGGFRATFRAADADVLFPTPVNPRIVVAWRVAADTLIRMLLPLLVSLIALGRGRGSLGSLAGIVPDSLDVTRAIQLASIGYLLIAVAFALLGWGISLWSFSPRNGTRPHTRWVYLGQALYLGAGIGMAISAFQSSPGLGSLVGFANRPGIRAYFFPAHLAERFALGVATGDPFSSVLGLAGLFGLIGLGAWLAMHFAPNLYEQAALRAYEVKAVTDRARKDGTSFSATLSRAERGGIGLGLTGWLYRWKAGGPWSIVWKESVLSLRVGAVQALIVTAMGATMLILMKIYAPARAINVLVPILCGLAPLFASPSARATVLPEALARLDLVKPLPFTSRQLLAWDALSRAVVPMAISIPVPIIGAAIGVGSAMTTVMAWLTGSVFAVTLSLSYLPVAILQPDARDAAQASVRGLATMIVLLPVTGLALAPPILCGVFRIPIWIGLAGSVTALVGVGIGMTYLAATMYDGFNPNDP